MTANTQTISGVVERIVFHNLDNGYVVLKVHIPRRSDLVTVVGRCGSVVAGEYVEAVGVWGNDKTHGPQFQADEIRTTPPHTIGGITKYLGSGLVKGIGPEFAKRIVAAFGERTLDVIDQTPMHLAEVKGIGPQRLERIRKSWAEQRGVRAILVFLQSFGIGTARAIRIYREYGDQAVELVKSNPYRLSSDIWGIGFRIADDLATRMGLPKDSPLRARAAVRHVLKECSSQGHVGFPEAGVIEQTVQLTAIQESIVREAIETGREEDEFIRDLGEVPGSDGDRSKQPWLFLKPLFLAELGVARSIIRLRDGSPPIPGENLEETIHAAQKSMGIELAAQQLDAVRSAARNRLTVITGGPGVGKTTIVRAIIDVYRKYDVRIALCAPTGRAAKRLAESTGLEARTIHRLLETDPVNGGFLRDPDNPIDAGLVVVDESSMVDITLMHQLLRAVPDGCAVVFVGDVDQLPSVGPGTVLRDVIASRRVPVVRLTRIFRQAESSYIVRAAHAVNSGEEPISAPSPLGDFFFVEADRPEAITDRIITMIRDRIPARFNLDPLRDIQVLAPMNKAEVGVQELNRRLQEVLNPPDPTRPETERMGRLFRQGDKVLQIRNNYQKEVFNGDIGRITSIYDREQELTVEFDGRSVSFEFNELDELVLAYAVSIHKSQGSEYPAVVIPLHTQHFVMLQRNLLYTGLTRGKKLVAIVGSRKALHIAVRNTDTALRYSLLQQRIATADKPARESHEPAHDRRME